MKRVGSVVAIVVAIAVAMWVGYRDGHEHRSAEANQSAARN